jgi:hypothetical protein
MELLDISESSFSDVARVIKPAALKQKLSEYADYLKKIYG